MAFDFPSTPQVGQVWTNGGVPWVWDGVAWHIDRNASPTLLKGSLASLVYVATAAQTAFPMTTPDVYGNIFVLDPGGDRSTQRVDVYGGGIRFVESVFGVFAGEFEVDRAMSQVDLGAAATGGEIIHIDITFNPGSATGNVESWVLKDLNTDWTQDPPVAGQIDGVRTAFQMFYEDGNASPTQQPVAALKGAELDIFVDGVRQRPGVNYTASGATLTFTTAPSAFSTVWGVWRPAAP